MHCLISVEVGTLDTVAVQWLVCDMMYHVYREP